MISKLEFIIWKVIWQVLHILQTAAKDVFAGIPTQTFARPRLQLLLNPFRQGFHPLFSSPPIALAVNLHIWKCMQTVSL